MLRPCYGIRLQTGIRGLWIKVTHLYVVLLVVRTHQAVVKDMRESESRTRDEMREIRDEVNTVREMLPKVSDAVPETTCAN